MATSQPTVWLCYFPFRCLRGGGGGFLCFVLHVFRSHLGVHTLELIIATYSCARMGHVGRYRHELHAVERRYWPELLLPPNKGALRQLLSSFGACERIGPSSVIWMEKLILLGY